MKLTQTLTHAARSALQWRLFVLWMVALLLPTLVFAIPFFQLFSAQFDFSADAAALARHLDFDNLDDLVSLFQQQKIMSQAEPVAVALALAILPWLSGVTLAAVRATAPLGFAAMTRAGFSDYWRMLRMSLWSLIPLAIAMAIGMGLGKAVEQYGEHATIEANVDNLRHLTQFISFLVLLIAQLTVEAARAQLALDSRLRSGLRAWFRGLKLLRRNPGATFVTFLLLTIAGGIVLSIFAVVRINLAAIGPLGLALAFIVAELIVVTVAWMKSARLFALAYQTRNS
jgi:hypothetical protein